MPTTWTNKNNFSSSALPKENALTWRLAHGEFIFAETLPH